MGFLFENKASMILNYLYQVIKVIFIYLYNFDCKESNNIVNYS